MNTLADNPLLRFSLCVVGMFVGFSIDAEQGRLATLTALCMGGERSVVTWLQLHWEQLPAMHGGMLISSIFTFSPIAIARDSTLRLFALTLRHAACFVFMFAGMYLGTLLHLFGGIPSSTPLMLIAMIAGMACGMKAGECLFPHLCCHFPPIDAGMHRLVEEGSNRRRRWIDWLLLLHIQLRFRPHSRSFSRNDFASWPR